MRKYYINNGQENLGPFNLNELRLKRIDRETMVWFFGLESWAKAKSVPELKELFSYSSRLKIGKPPLLENQYDSEEEKNKEIYFETRKSLVFIGIVLAIGLCIVFYAFLNIHRISKNEAEREIELQKDKEGLIEAYSKNNYNDQKKTVIIEEEKSEAEKHRITKRIKQIEIELNVAYENLETAKEKLYKATEFKLMRSPEERRLAVQVANNEITIWKDEIRILEKEMRELEAKSRRREK